VPEYRWKALSAAFFVDQGSGPVVAESPVSKSRRALAWADEMGYQRARLGNCRKISRQLVLE